jgi:Bacterial chaperone lipoprotein (PulS_OutS).
MFISLFAAGDVMSINPPLAGRSRKAGIIKIVAPAGSVLTLNFRDVLVEAMKTFFRTILFSTLMINCANSYALSENEAEDMADLTAVFVFLKNDCGYQNLPNGQIRRALVFFAQQNQWDLSNYDSFDMKSLGEDSYRDLSGIGIPTAKKCKALARDSLSLLAYVK